MKTLLIRIFIVLSSLYILVCGILYFFQEKLIFYPEKLTPDYHFGFGKNCEELSFKTQDGIYLNGLLFKSSNPKGLIFYLHGNAGSLASWGEVAQTYTRLNYDVFLLDYRGYGKSGGKITTQTQVFDDNQLVYDQMITKYPESKIIILGYSIGTGLAAKLASDNHPNAVILQAPYYSLTDMMKHKFPFLPTFILKYKFQTNEFLKKVNFPITVFHGDADEVIYYGSAVKLHDKFPQINFITLPGQGHNGITENEDYLNHLPMILK